MERDKGKRERMRTEREKNWFASRNKKQVSRNSENYRVGRQTAAQYKLGER